MRVLPLLKETHLSQIKIEMIHKKTDLPKNIFKKLSKENHFKRIMKQNCFKQTIKKIRATSHYWINKIEKVSININILGNLLVLL